MRRWVGVRRTPSTKVSNCSCTKAPYDKFSFRRHAGWGFFSRSGDTVRCVRVQSIHIYPVKGCYRTDLSEASVEPWGLRGDRRFMIVDEDDVMLTQRECQAMVKVKPAWDGSRLTLRAA